MAAFQLGSLNSTPVQQVGQSGYRSGNYKDFFSNSKKKKQAFEDKEKLNALGDARSTAILDSQGGSEVIQGLREQQKTALANKDSDLYDKVTEELKTQMKIEAAEAKADPFGKNQMSRDKFAQSQKGSRELPLIEGAVRAQTEAKEKALNILDEYFKLDEEPSKEIESQFRQRYMDEWRKQKDAMATLSRYPESSSHNFQKLSEWSKAVAGGAKERNAKAITDATVKKLMADTDMTLQEARGYAEKLEMEKQAAKQKLSSDRASQTQRAEKHSLDIAAKNQSEYIKELASLGLFPPSVYDRNIKEASAARGSNQIAIIAKVLNGLIEKGLATNEGEVNALVGMDKGAIEKYFINLTGSKAAAMDNMIDLINKMANGRKAAAMEVRSKSQFVTDEQKSSGAESKAEIKARMMAKFGKK